jgi:hypothetical protein
LSLYTTKAAFGLPQEQSQYLTYINLFIFAASCGVANTDSALRKRAQLDAIPDQEDL